MSRCVLYFCSCCCCCLFISYPIHAFHKQRMSAGRRIHWPPMMQVKHMFHSLTKSLPPLSLSLSLFTSVCLSLNRALSMSLTHTRTHTWSCTFCPPFPSSPAQETKDTQRRESSPCLAPLSIVSACTQIIDLPRNQPNPQPPEKTPPHLV